jgi:transcriptional antiterminator Rof (Rho-off)
MKATVREYTVKKKVVVIELPVEEVESILRVDCITSVREQEILATLRDVLEADRAEELRKDTEDVPF